MLQIKNLTKRFGDRYLFEDVTWFVSKGDRIGLTGPNGSGKTTLLRVFTGEVQADEGGVVLPRGTTVGYLPQEGLRHRGRTLREEALTAFSGLIAIGKEQRELESKMAELDPQSHTYQSLVERYGECQEEWDRQEGFSMEARSEEVLLGLGFRTAELDAPTESFSGGWQMRIALAKLLLSRPNLLLLDEPTNHLDLEARDWLEGYLAAYPHAVVLVSHDRYFLDQVVTRITEIDRRRLVDFPGSYSSYVEVREAQLLELRAKARRQQEEIERIQRFIDRFRYKASKAAQVQSRVKMLEKIEVIEVPPERKRVTLRLPEPPRSGRVVIELKDFSKRYENKVVFDQADLTVERGERIAVVGPNGAGKSTLMRILSGEEPPDQGRLELGHKTAIGYFSQERYDLDSDKTVLASLMATAPIDLVSSLRNILGAFLFHGDDVDKRVKVLSGGEKSRLALARMLLRPANVLLLDEPTNHLDIDSKEVLLEALKAYKGTLLFVAHDRYFLDQLASKVAEIGGGAVTMHWGSYSEFLERKQAELDARDRARESERARAASSPPKPASEAPGKAAVSKNRARELRERVDRLEETIAETETAVDSLEGRMAVTGFYDDPESAQQVTKTHQELKRKLEELYREWEELAEKTPAAQ